ncbi:MAG TPA: hypothetical protein VG406_03905 [Isosphaeraceae bacterium]|jgi:hypothetical protein|nr:hypothetical protein [Isosphaeraceae bacterium]
MGWGKFQVRLRTLLILVALVALALGAESLLRWRDVYRRKLNEHALIADLCDGPGTTTELLRKAAFHRELAQKYEQAARHPWSPVAPDPPEPK